MALLFYPYPLEESHECHPLQRRCRVNELLVVRPADRPRHPGKRAKPTGPTQVRPQAANLADVAQSRIGRDVRQAGRVGPAVERQAAQRLYRGCRGERRQREQLSSQDQRLRDQGGRGVDHRGLRRSVRTPAANQLLPSHAAVRVGFGDAHQHHPRPVRRHLDEDQRRPLLHPGRTHRQVDGRDHGCRSGCRE